jgi:hypothetical protein
MGRFKALEGGTGWVAVIGDKPVKFESEDALVDMISKGTGWDKAQAEKGEARKQLEETQKKLKEQTDFVSAYDSLFGNAYDALTGLSPEERSKRVEAIRKAATAEAIANAQDDSDPFGNGETLTKAQAQKLIDEQVKAALKSAGVDGLDSKVSALISTERTRDAIVRAVEATGIEDKRVLDELYLDALDRAGKDDGFSLKKVPEIVSASLKAKRDAFRALDERESKAEQERKDAQSRRLAGSMPGGSSLADMGKDVKDPNSAEGRAQQLAYLRAMRASRTP